jgi:hypothetical protein
MQYFSFLMGAGSSAEPLPDCRAATGPAAMDALVDVIVHKHAPLPDRSLAELARLRAFLSLAPACDGAHAPWL